MPGHQRHDGLGVDPGEKRKSWSASDTLFTFNVDKKVSLQALFGEAGPYTVQFSITPDDVTLASVIECTAEIEWTVDGNTVNRRVTVANGASVSGVAEGVRVVVHDVTTTGLANVEYAVAITVAMGVRPASALPPIHTPSILVSPVLLLAFTSFDFPIPKNVGVTSVLVLVASDHPGIAAPPPIPEQSVQVRHIAPGIIPVLNNYDPRSMNFVPIAPGANIVRVLNQFAPLGPSVWFTVFFGVDG